VLVSVILTFYFRFFFPQQQIQPPLPPPNPPAFPRVFFLLQFLFVAVGHEPFSPVCNPLLLFGFEQFSLTEVFALLGCYAAYVGSSPKFWGGYPSKQSSSIGFNAENKRDLIEVLNILRQFLLLRLKMDGILDRRSKDIFMTLHVDYGA
jgi:hypothetical protein